MVSVGPSSIPTPWEDLETHPRHQEPHPEPVQPQQHAAARRTPAPPLRLRTPAPPLRPRTPVAELPLRQTREAAPFQRLQAVPRGHAQEPVTSASVAKRSKPLGSTPPWAQTSLE